LCFPLVLCYTQPPRRSLDGYKHVVDVEYCPPVSSDGAHFPPEAAKAKEAAQSSPSPQNTLEYHEIVEEEMIRGLQTLGWKKVDVSFHSTFWPYLAHNNIHVKSQRLHKAGAGVVAHVVDSIKQQESSTFITASL
ncbi:BnaCnng62350D, partial [Brassica napus]